jgi:hypothetical protein
MLGNLLATSPDAIAAQKEQKTADRVARQEELDRLREKLDFYTTERNVKKLLPDDVELMKKFLKGRISTLQAQPSITEDALLTLKDNKESQNYDNLDKSAKIRAKFHALYTGYKASYEGERDSLKAKKTPVPDSFGVAIKIAEDALAWLKKSPFETPDVYDDKRKEYDDLFSAKTGGQAFGEAEKQTLKAEEDQTQCRDTFSVAGLFKDLGIYLGSFLGVFLLGTTMLLGSSLATNLNVYKHWSFRLLYAIYGAVFSFLVIPYVLGYRWFWLGKRPKFYSLIPLFPYHWNNRLVQILLGWISFRPDEDILALREWEHRPASTPSATA